MIIVRKLLGDARVVLKAEPEQSHQVIITSPPYWGLRSYGTPPLIWSGDPNCNHEWEEEIPGRKKNAGESVAKCTLGVGSGGNAMSDEAKARARNRQEIKLPASCFCRHCFAWRGELGSEPMLELYLDNLMEVFRECWRVLRNDGTMWVNIGDAYANNSSGNPQKGMKALTDKWSPRSKPRQNHRAQDTPGIYTKKKRPDGFKLKDLMMLPARVALRLQDEGWYLRAQVPWIKRNAMPESATDRPAVAIEYVYLFSKSADYFYDRYAVMVEASKNSHPRMSQDVMAQIGSERAYGGKRHNGRMKPAGNHRFSPELRGINPKAMSEEDGRAGNVKQHEGFQEAMALPVSKRNRRNTDWFFESWQGMVPDDCGDPLAFLINPKGTTISHFASYPKALVRPMILASTSEKGHCAFCHAPFMRVIEDGEADLEHQKACGANEDGEYLGLATKEFGANGVQNASDVKRRILAGMKEKKLVAWECGCRCVLAGEEIEGNYPCSVLDPFGGTGTTSSAAVELGRRATSAELNPKYFKDSDIKDSQGALSIL